jgi:hypothetical protein
MWVIVRYLNLSYNASITLHIKTYAARQGEGDLRSSWLARVGMGGPGPQLAIMG